ncbi:MAG: iron-containing redox enzyme family protein [Deltaproteobacteria bacterium]|nr:iron-containing redox enzyme family protein [Deltaproteobacteria bacterium]
MTKTAATFLKDLRAEVESHPGTNHMFLCRLAWVPFTREDYLVASTQHYPLVGTFTRYLEELLLRAPTSEAKSWLAKVLVDEYGEGSEGKDHRTLYREYLVAAGLEGDTELDTPLHKDVTAFVFEHLRIVKEEPFLVGLGAVGPGHEWSIPKMFPPIIQGLRKAGFSEQAIAYFTLHTLQDIDHGRWLEEALLLNASTSKAQQEIRRGALLSLEARERFWSGVQDKVTRWRQPQNVHLRTQARGERFSLRGLAKETVKDQLSRFQKAEPELTLRQLRALTAVPNSYVDGAA